MQTLQSVLEDVRAKIAQYRGKEMNEQNTKTALIDPVLRALGWDVGNLDEVSQEYKRQSRDKPVDYALFLLRTPKLFVEAKALGQNLDDRKWANQIMGYAAVAGVKWTVITNGDDYRIYNACVDVPIEEKLFRTVRVSDAASPVAETLALLSKERIRDNDIEVLWKAHFVDRQVRQTLEQLFSAEPDGSIVRLVRKHVAELSAKDVRASLARMRVTFNFPVEMDGPPLPRRRRADRPAAPTGKRQSTHAIKVSLKDVIEAGLLQPPVKLFRRYKGTMLESELLVDGRVRFQGEAYRTCSTAADVARGTITGRKMNTNGWSFWQYRLPDGKAVELDAARQEYLKRQSKRV